MRKGTPAILALAALVNILPMLIFTIGGDTDFHLMLLHCFSGQFWQGDVYPRWCMDANAGLGGPFFIFYFPLAYFIGALLHPLEWLGVMPYGIYIISMALATFVTGLTCYSWLKDIVSPGRALLASLLFLFMPYRMEAMLFRAAYAEIWAIAWLPLLCKYTRRIARGEEGAVPPLAGTFALLFLTHLPCAVAGLLASGLYISVMGGKRWLARGRYALAMLWGAGMAAFFFIPGIYYRRFMLPIDRLDVPKAWANSFLSRTNLDGQATVVVTIGLTLLALGILSLCIIWKSRRMEDGFVKREIRIWACICVAAFFLLVPISAPLYSLLGPLSLVVFPWRMQGALILGLTWMLAVWMEWFASPRQLRTWKCDFSMLLALMILMSYFVAGVRDPDSDALSAKITASGQATQSEYRTLWVDKAHFDQEYVFSRYDNRRRIPAAEIVSGEGSVQVLRWSPVGIVLETQSASKDPLVVRLNQLYFPIWSGFTARETLPLTFWPDPETGQLLVKVPHHEQRVTLTYSLSNSAPLLMWLCNLTSLLLALLWLWQSFRPFPGRARSP